MTKEVNIFTGEVTEVDTAKIKIYIDGFEEPMTIDEAIKKASEFRVEAYRLLDYAKTPVQSGEGNNYSRCGYEDGQAQDREDAKTHAAELFTKAEALEKS